MTKPADMHYLLDSSALIDAARDYYPLHRVPEFWDWLEYWATRGQVAVVPQVYKEVMTGSGPLADWTRAHQAALLDETKLDNGLMNRVFNEGYAPGLTMKEMDGIGADPFLVACGVASPGQATIVTMEKSRPCRKRANRHIPDVCKALGVPCINTFELIRRLDFRTDWRHRLDV